MESAFAIQGQGFVLLVQESTVVHSIFKLKEKQEKSIELDSHILLGLVGDLADQREFSSELKNKFQFYKFQNRKSMNMNQSANYLRHLLAEAVRKSPVQINSLLAGFDREGAQLFWLDAYGTMQKVPYGAHGYASYFVSSVIANSYKNNLSLEEAIEISRQCVFELRKRMIITQEHFILKIVDQQGIRELTV
jgi:20S proteasome subunit beta 4